MDKIDKYFADKCGVKQHQNAYIGKWTIKDARCREVVREKFEIQTRHSWIEGKPCWICEATVQQPEDQWNEYWEHGKTIAEAEVACLKSIYEAEKGDE